MRDAWTVRDEKDFSAWYKAKVSTQFLQGSGLDVDCAEPQGFCDWNNYQCSLADFLYSKHNMIDNLRDDPSVPYARRFEF